MKKILILCFLLMLIFGCSKNTTDALRFKEEYESYNNQVDEDNNLYRYLEISKDNPIIYTDYKSISLMIKEKQTFVIYFGYGTCPWCRSCIETFLECAKNNDIDEVYYVDISTSRDNYQYTQNGLEYLKCSDENYYLLLDDLANILNDYYITDLAGNLINMNEKRIYAPSFIVIKNGEALQIEQFSNLLNDPNGKLTSEILDDLTTKYQNLLKLIK